MEGLLAIVPIVLIVGSCLLMMRFMHGGKGEHAAHAETPTPSTLLAEDTKKT